MKKGVILVIVICIAVCLVFVGLKLSENKGKEQVSNDVTTNTTTNTTNTNETSNNTITVDNNKTKNDITNNKATNENLKPTEIKKEYEENLPLGLEVRHITINGNDVAVNLQTTGSSEQQENGPYYIYYELRVGYDEYHGKYKLVKEGIYHLEGFGVEMLKTFDIEEDAGTNYEFFERDLTTSVYKGTDKEYVAISLPAGTADKNQATLLLSTDEGDLVGEFTADIVKDITLTGTNADNYKNYSGDVVFNSIKDGKITYLVPTDKMYKQDAQGNKVLDTSLDTLELDEYSVNINKNKATSEKTGETYKITGASGKTLSFGTFRH